MRQSAPTPPVQPSPPGAAVEQPVAPTAAPGVPQSFGEVRALRAQRSELSNQLQSAERRRDEVAEMLTSASPAERPGLEARLKLLDDRILEIEGEIARTGELIAQTPGQLLTTTSTAPPTGPAFMRIDVTAITAILSVFVLAPLAFTAARLMWRRATTAPPRLDTETQERMRRLEAGVDAIALEVERISEGQRFVTKLLAEREKQQALRSSDG